MEFHRAFGTDYKTLAACQLKFRELLEKPHGRIHGSAKLTGKIIIRLMERTLVSLPSFQTKRGKNIII